VERNQLLFLLDSVQEEAIRDEAAASLSEARAQLARALAARERKRTSYEEMNIRSSRAMAFEGP
jgi:multidrug efflux pump subunit AcrA (membrane-fusion protein)